MEIWKLVLAWACLVTFFVTPVVLFIIHIFYHLGKDPSFAVEFKWIGEYLRTITAIIISLAGFNTVELFKRPNKEDGSH